MKLDGTFTINGLAEITRLDRRTIKLRLSSVKPKAGRYALASALPALCTVEDSRGGSESESRRLLNDSRRTLADLQAQAIRRERIPIADLNAVNDLFLRNVRGIILASRLDDASKADVFAEMRDMAKRLAEVAGAPSPRKAKHRR